MSTKPLSMAERIGVAVVCVAISMVIFNHTMSTLLNAKDVLGISCILAIITAVVVTGQTKIRQAEASKRFRVVNGGKQ